MRDMIGTMDAFIPHPVYEFRGGPVGGQRPEVRLIDLGDDRGYICPDIWRVADNRPPPTSVYGSGPVDEAVPISTYRFVNTARRNQGYYEYVPDA